MVQKNRSLVQVRPSLFQDSLMFSQCFEKPADANQSYVLFIRSEWRLGCKKHIPDQNQQKKLYYIDDIYIVWSKYKSNRTTIRYVSVQDKPKHGVTVSSTMHHGVYIVNHPRSLRQLSHTVDHITAPSTRGTVGDFADVFNTFSTLVVSWSNNPGMVVRYSIGMRTKYTVLVKLVFVCV